MRASSTEDVARTEVMGGSSSGTGTDQPMIGAGGAIEGDLATAVAPGICSSGDVAPGASRPDAADAGAPGPRASVEAGTSPDTNASMMAGSGAG
jgi:hypothetical protein